MTDKQIIKLNEITEMSQELGLYEDRPDWRITLQADHIKRLEEELKAKEQECDQLKVENLSLKRGIEIAKEADKSWISQLKAENDELRMKNRILETECNEMRDVCNEFEQYYELLMEGHKNLKQTLTEIKNKLTVHKTLYYESKLIEKLHKEILQKISECEE